MQDTSEERGDDPGVGLSGAEQRTVEERIAPRSPVLYEVVRRQGEDELARPAASLFWSGIAGGIAIMASVVAEGALHTGLPDAPWRPLVSHLGYSLGFLIVILGRMQLFTEQTIVAVLPVAAQPTREKLGGAARLWAIVLAANLLGTAAAAFLSVFGGLHGPELLAAMLEVSHVVAELEPTDALLRGIPAGFLIASVAWIRAGAAGDHFWIILAITYVIAASGSAHVIAGSAEAFLLVFAGSLGPAEALLGFVLPALVGNVIGGTGLFALLAYAQVREEL